MKAALSILALALVLAGCQQSPQAVKEHPVNAMEDDIWKLEERYFTNLYKADYDGVLAMIHPQFLGWPGNLPKPINRDESGLFMKKLIPKPTACAITIEPAGLQQSGDTILTQYTLLVSCPEIPGKPGLRASRITHTWVRNKGRWQLLGGMSLDIQTE